MENIYGHFSDDKREFIITNPRTPRPWFNYMWNEHYGGLISHTGGGFSFLDCPRDNRLTRMRYNSLPWDRPGRYIVIKDVETGKYWSLSWAPTIDVEYGLYECHHGQGYTKIITEVNGIRGEITYFVPNDLNAEIWRVRLVNKSMAKRNLEIYSFTELMMGNALNDIINQPNDKHFTEIVFDKKEETLIATRRYWVLNKKVSVAQPNIDWKNNILFTTTLPVKGFDGSLDKFIGKWRSEANPIAIESGKMSNSEITAGDPVAALQSVVTIEEQGEINFATLLAVVAKTVEEPFEFLNYKKLKTIEHIDDLFNNVKLYWNKYLNHVHVQTPDEKFNTMLNVWNQYQCAVTFDMARNAGYYHGGLLFGTGMRDQFQDILGMVIPNPDRVRKRLLNALRFQFQDGSTLHNFFKMTDSGERTNHSDTPLWIPFGIIEYLNETGDFSFLDEEVNYYDQGKGTVYEHLINAANFAISATTERGLPKIMNGDWNDTLDHIGPKGKGETVWGAFFLAYILKKSFPLLEYKNDTATLGEWKKFYTKLGVATNNLCWDGNWYLRAFKDNGDPVGSNIHSQGKVFINAQTWSVISGLAPAEYASKALEACRKYLATPYGMQIVFPSFAQIEDDIGLISRCVPGKKENGAVFNHASSWYVLAALLNNETESAYDIYSKMLPLNSSKNIDSYEVEPYVFAEYVTSPDHSTENQASHSWLTGTSVWMYRIGLDFILGFTTDLFGVTISPRIPSAWKNVNYVRYFRGKKFSVVINNNENGNSKIKSVLVNGKTSASNYLKLEDLVGDEVTVVVELTKN